MKQSHFCVRKLKAKGIKRRRVSNTTKAERIGGEEAGFLS